VTDRRRRDEADGPPRGPRAAAEVGLLEVEEVARVEAAERAEVVAADEHRRAEDDLRDVARRRTPVPLERLRADPQEAQRRVLMQQREPRRIAADGIARPTVGAD